MSDLKTKSSPNPFIGKTTNFGSNDVAKRMKNFLGDPAVKLGLAATCQQKTHSQTPFLGGVYTVS